MTDFKGPEIGTTAAPRSVVAAILPYVVDFVLRTPLTAPQWLQRLPIPPGWQRGRIDGDALQPTRTLVCGERSQGGWDGCDTLTLYTCSGVVPHEAILQANAWTLEDFGADGVTTYLLSATEEDRRGAVRSSGYFTLGDRRLWAQYSTYFAAGNAPGASILLLHNLFLGTDDRARLRDDVADLGDAVQAAFSALTDTVDDDPPTTPLPVGKEDQDGP